MDFLLYKLSTLETGGWVAERLIQQGIELDHGFVPPAKVDTLIRWGTSKKFPVKVKGVVNKRTALTLARNKLDSLAILQDKGILTPCWTTKVSEAKTMLPVIARTKFHQEGKNLFLCLQISDLTHFKTKADYFIKYIPTAKEYRFHVFHDKVLRVFEKSTVYGEDAKVFCRNNAYAHFSVSDFSDGNDTAIKAVQVLGLDFGAVDMLKGDDGKLYVLEVNTAPRLNHKTIDLYVNKFASLLEGEDES